MLAVLIVPHTRGRWIEFGELQFQPSEFMKVFFILFLSRIMINLEHKDIYFRELIIPVIITLIPAILIAVEPDIGTAAIFVFILLGLIWTLNIPTPRYFLYISPVLSIFFGFNLISWILFMVLLIIALFVSDIKFRNGLILFILNLLTGSLAPVLPILLKPYQKERLLSFLNPSWDPTGAGWHSLQSRISIGSGGFWGKGYLNGIIKNLGFLPQTRTDFIFAVLGEEFGFWGTSIFVMIFGFFLWRILVIAGNTREPFRRNVVHGIFFYFLSHFAINIAMTLGILPVVGLPLPFISYGGTSMLVSCILVGIVVSISSESYV